MKLLLPFLLLSLASTGALAGDTTTTLTLNNHKFSPAEIHVKANTPTTVTITNNDDQAEEFDSTTLRIEKIVAGHSTGIMRWRPLAPGRYPFMGEFNSETARGVVVSE